MCVRAFGVCVFVCVSLCVYLEDVGFEDVMAELNGLLSVEFVLLAGEPEGQQGVSTPANSQTAGGGSIMHTGTPQKYKFVHTF